jgi:hypothetical protein
MPLLRLLPLVLFALVSALVVGALAARVARPAAHRDAYRPRRRAGPWRPTGEEADTNGTAKAAGEPAGTVHLATRAALAGLRDALTSAPIDPDQPLLRCGQCQSVYHASSVQALGRDNGGRCVGCGGRELSPLAVAD